MKYLKLYEAFEAGSLSRTLNFLKGKIGSKSTSDFSKVLKNIIQIYDIPIDKIPDDKIMYCGSRRALSISSPEKIENKWGIYCLKFWFSLKEGYLGYTATSSKKFPKRTTQELTDNDILSIRLELGHNRGELKRVNDYSRLKTGDNVFLSINGTRAMVKGVIFLDHHAQGNRTLVINNIRNGTNPRNNGWQQYGGSAWTILNNDGYINPDHSKLYLYTKTDTPLHIISEEETDVYDYNLPMIINTTAGAANVTIMPWDQAMSNRYYITSIKSFNLVESADFGIVLYLDDILKLSLKSVSSVKLDRTSSKLGALKMMTDADIRNNKTMKHIRLYESFVGRMDIETKITLNDQEFKDAVMLLATELSTELNGEVEPEVIIDDLSESGDPNLSIATYLKKTGEMIGALVCTERGIDSSLETYDNPKVEWYIDYSDIEGLKGIEGLALSIKEEYRGGFGVVSLLYSIKSLGDYDYIILQQYESLKANINYNTKGCEKLCRVEADGEPEAIIYYLRKLN